MGNKIRNNVFWINSIWWDAEIDGDDKDSWDISSNVWLGVDYTPLNDTLSPASIALVSQDGSQVFSDLCDYYDFNMAGAPSACFTPGDSSPLLDAGAHIAVVPRDYFDDIRSTTAPTIGFAEYPDREITSSEWYEIPSDEDDDYHPPPSGVSPGGKAALVIFLLILPAGIAGAAIGWVVWRKHKGEPIIPEKLKPLQEKATELSSKIKDALPSKS